MGALGGLGPVGNGLGGDPFAGAMSFGFEVPTGDPGAVTTAAASVRRVGDAVGQQAVALRSAGRTAVGADGGWRGSAASAFESYGNHVAGVGTRGAGGAHEAAAALQSFAHALEHAQAVTRQALSECHSAQGELTRQQALATSAGQAAQSARQGAATALNPRASTTLATQAGADEGQQQAAQRAATAAQGRLDAAKRRGQEAFHTYQQAARSTNARLISASGEMQMAPAIAGGAPVPVSVTSVDVRLAKTIIADGGHVPPGRHLTPGTVVSLLAQIDEMRRMAKLRHDDQPLDGSVGGVIPGPVGQVLQGAWNTLAGTGKLVVAGATHPLEIRAAVTQYLRNAVLHPGAFLKGLIDYRDFSQGHVAKGIGAVGVTLLPFADAGKLADALRSPAGAEAVTRGLVKLASSRGVAGIGDAEEILAQIAKNVHPENRPALLEVVQRVEQAAGHEINGPQLQRIINQAANVPGDPRVIETGPRPDPRSHPPVNVPRNPPVRVPRRGSVRGR